MHIGLIGGIGPAATDFYYRRLISAFATNNAQLDLTIVHADSPTLLNNLRAGDAPAQVAIYTRLTKRLVAAGAACVAVTSIAGHFCIHAFEQVSPLPVVNMIRGRQGHRIARTQAHRNPWDAHPDGNPLLRKHPHR